MSIEPPLVPYAATGVQLRAARLAKAISRRVLAEFMHVHVSTVSAWEAGARQPRPEQRVRLSWVLGCDVSLLFPEMEASLHAPPTAAMVDTIKDLPDLLVDCLSRTKRRLRAFRFAASYPTSAFVQVEWRQKVEERLLSGGLCVERAEIVYSLERLKEMLSNIIRYNAKPYYVKSYCAGLSEVAPFMGGYMFDDMEYLLGAYWETVPPSDLPGLRLSGAPFATYFNAYWNEIWRRGKLLNIRGANDLSAVQVLARQLGLPNDKWDDFVDEARAFSVGDGAPPLF